MGRRHMKLKEFIYDKKIIGLIIILVVSLILYFFIGVFSGDKQYSSLAISTDDYVEKIVATGQAQYATQITILAEVEGRIQSITSRDGQIIPNGNQFLTIYNADQEYELKSKEAAYIQASSDYEQLISFEYPSSVQDSNYLSTEKERAKKDYDSAILLYDTGAISELELLEKKAAYELALSEAQSALYQERSLGDNGALRKNAYAKLENAKAAYDNVLNNQQKYQIIAPWDAILLKAYVNPSDFVSKGDILAEIGKIEEYEVVVDIDEKYYPFLKTGMDASVALENSIENSNTQGVISSITPLINEDTGSFQVIISLPQTFQYQATNLTVTVTLPIYKMDDAIVIPKEYLSDDENHVYLYLDGKTRLTAIEYQKMPSSQLVVIKGLKSGDQIILPDEFLVDGESVKLK